MTMNELRAGMQGPEYGFLRDEVQLGQNIIILTVAGSIAYGTNLGTSDIDLRGVAVETEAVLFGLKTFEQFEDRATDTVIYGLKKFIHLCLACNPNMMELLGTNGEHCVILTEAGRLLRDNSELFLSKRAIQSFGNYATAQLHRLQNALIRNRPNNGEAEEHILNRVHNQIAHLKRNFTELTGGKLELYLDSSKKQGMDTEIHMDIELRHFPLRDFKTIYSDISAVVRDYSGVNHRNNKKDEPHLYKHAMHLMRLLATGTDILNGKGIVTYRGDERDLYLSIRQGMLSFEEIFRLVDQYEAKFKLASQQTRLPDEPDFQRVEKLMTSIYRNCRG